MCTAPDVVEIHDLHVWSVTAGFPALSAHVVVRPGANRDRARAGVEALLRDRFHIGHSTLQVVERHDTGDLIPLEPVDGSRRQSTGQ
jgi:cobalt-zinc-cadmium efflux system protein